MNKILLTVAFACGVLTLCAAEASSTSDPRILKPKIDPRLIKTGGMIDRPGVKPGWLGVYNAQSVVSTADLSPIVSYIETHVKLKTVVEESSSLVDYKSIFAKRRGSAATLSLFVVDTEDVPVAFSVFPEERMAVVNVSVLRKDGAASQFLAARVRKELVRGFLYIAGGASSTSVQNLMGPVHGCKELDNFTDDAVPVDVLARVMNYLPQAGCPISTKVAYRRACQEGWAPQPTNDIQKAIWNQVHEKPTNPIRIKYDPKRGE